MKWSTALPDWRERILDGRSLIPCDPLFQSEADAALAVFKELKVVDLPKVPGADGPRFQTFGEVCRPWVFEFVAAIFGAYDAETGRRLINEFLLLISKKNGKSTIAAGIMVTALILNWRYTAELSILAPTIEVAKNSADPAMAMVLRDPFLFEILKPIPHQRAIEHRTTSAVLKIIAADQETAAGSKAGFVLIDEEWLFGKSAKAENMMLEATGGLTSRPEGFVIKLSTQSDEPPAGIWKDDLKRFRDIRDGILEAPRSLGVLYEFPESMIKDGSYKNPDFFYVTNPNLEASVPKDVLLDKLSKAQQSGIKSLVGFFAKHLNVEPGMAQRSDNWSGAEFWERQTDETITFESILERCEVVVPGVDGGGLDDLFGLSILGRERAEVIAVVEEEHDGQIVKVRKPIKRWLHWGHAWCHKGVLERRKSIASVLLDFQKAGELTIVDDELDDVSQIVDYIKRVKDAGLLAKVAVDPAGIGEFVDALADPEVDITVENELLIGAAQGYAQMNAIKTTERKLANKTFWHSKSGLMAWAVGNVKIEPTATAIRATKQSAGDAKIDPWSALIDSATVMEKNPEASAQSYLTDEPLLVL